MGTQRVPIIGTQRVPLTLKKVWGRWLGASRGAHMGTMWGALNLGQKLHDLGQYVRLTCAPSSYLLPHLQVK